MLQSFDYPTFAYRPPPDLTEDAPRRYPVAVVGAGPVGLCAALDLARRGHDCIVLDEDDTLSVGSRAICWAKRTLEICDRLGIGEPVLDRGVTWKDGRVFFRRENIYDFDLLPEEGHKFPAFVNLQQYRFEAIAVEAAEAEERIDLRWRSRVTGVQDQGDHVSVEVETPDGRYRLNCDWLIAADGAKSAIRRWLGLDFRGRVFEDRFLIADVKMQAGFPTERWFWFDPPFNPGQSALLHRQADDIWRIDLQLGWDADPDEARQPENVIPRIRRMLGEDAPFDLEWVSVYTFQCRRLEKFLHNRVIFVGDAAHQVSPFGARGGNGGVQDIDNLIWKLALVLDGKAPPALLRSFDEERIAAADENILNSTRSTDFITPKSEVSRIFRDSVLTLAKTHGFARRLVNSGRLSVPAVLAASPLNTPDADAFDGGAPPGAPCPDAPVAGPDDRRWLLEHLGDGFVLLAFWDESHAGTLAVAATSLSGDEIPVSILLVEGPGAGPWTRIEDRGGLVRRRYDGAPGTAVLIRPDQHVCARWRRLDVEAIRAAVARATGRAVAARRLKTLGAAE